MFLPFNQAAPHLRGKQNPSKISTITIKIIGKTTLLIAAFTSAHSTGNHLRGQQKRDDSFFSFFHLLDL